MLLPELLGVKSADDVWTSYLRNADGMVTKMVEGDTDADASTIPAGARETYFFHGSASFPGRMTEKRVHSALYDGTCDAGTTTACRRTLYALTSGGLLDTVQETGWTLTSSGSTTTYSFTTDYDYDGYGRLTTIYGPRASTADDIEFTYHTSAGLSQGYLYQVKRKKATDVYVTTSYSDYDYWGNPTTVTDPNSKTTSSTYHADYNVLVSREVDALDEEYVYTYDTHRRLTKIRRPKLNCQVYAYDSEGRLSSIAEKDYNSGTATCDITQESVEYTYSDPEGLLTKTEWKDSGATVKKRQEQTHRADRRLYTLVNPVSTGYHKSWYYDDDGVPSELRFEDYATSSAKTA